MRGNQTTSGSFLWQVLNEIIKEDLYNICRLSICNSEGEYEQRMLFQYDYSIDLLTVIF